MTKNASIALTLSLGLLISGLARANFETEKTLHFNVNKEKIAQGTVQISSLYGSTEDVDPLWPSELDPGDILKLKAGGFLAVKSAYAVKKNIQQINDPKLFNTDNISNFLPRMSVVESAPDGRCVVQTPAPEAPFGLLEPYLRCTLDFRHYPKAQTVAQDKNLGSPAAHTDQSCAEFNMLFERFGSINRYYPLDSHTTAVVSYQLYAIRNKSVIKARFIPGFDLKKRILEQIKSEIESSIKALNRETSK